MLDPSLAGGPVSLPIAGDDAEAKRVVAALAAGIGLVPVDVGPLRYAHVIEGLHYRTSVMDSRVLQGNRAICSDEGTDDRCLPPAVARGSVARGCIMGNQTQSTTRVNKDSSGGARNLMRGAEPPSHPSPRLT